MDLLPPRDLLQQVEGVESGLRHGRRARLIGVVLAAIQVTILIASNGWVSSLLNGDWTAVLDKWPLLVSLFVLVLSVFVVTWSRFWVHESKQPFRYTYSIAPFEVVAGQSDVPLLVSLHVDLRERLSQRITRLSYRSDPPPDARSDAPKEGAEEAREQSHLHITGTYAIRRRPPEERLVVEVTPWVRVGSATDAATLAVPVRYALEDTEQVDSNEQLDSRLFTFEHYEQVLERAYFSVATEIYQQIKEDVGRKLDLLPNRWFRASALFYEAEDYASSNTLDAYNEARELYEAAFTLYDPGSQPLPESWPRRPLAAAARALSRWQAAARRGASRVVPRVGRSEVLAARALAGYATTLLDISSVAGLSGLKPRAAYEAAPIARRAVGRLTNLDDGVPTRNRSLFEAEVCLAQASYYLGSADEAREALTAALSEDPRDAEADPRYLYVRANLEPRLVARISLFQSAVEHAPRFEAAQFSLAESQEMLWRRRPTLEKSVADSVLREYNDLLTVNPSNVAAWSNRGYIQWLLGRAPDAQRSFESGRRFKDIRREAYVAELDHGLARLAAEEGDFANAYSRYVAAVSARMAHAWEIGSYEGYYFQEMGPAMLERFEGYAATVCNHFENPPADKPESTKRIRTSVYAFVLNDVGLARLYYYLQSGERCALDMAYEAFAESARLSDAFVLPRLNLVQVERERRLLAIDGRAPEYYLDEIEHRQPGWPEAALQLLLWHGERVTAARRDVAEIDKHLEKLNGELKQLEAVPGSQYGDDSRPAAARPDLGALRDDIAGREAERVKLNDEVERRGQDAVRLPRTLLPHRWLWLDDDWARPDNFNWGQVTAQDARRELRWERSFEPFHVEALVAWCEYLVQSELPPPRLDELLDLIELRFLPADWGFTNLRIEREQTRAAPPDGRLPRLRRDKTPTSYRTKLEDTIKWNLQLTPASFSVLRWFDGDMGFAVPHLMGLVDEDALSPSLLCWIGNQLLLLGDRQAVSGAARTALERACAARHPVEQIALGDGFSALELNDEAIASYKRAAGLTEDPALLAEIASRLEGLHAIDQAQVTYEQAQAAEKPDEPQHRESFYRAALARTLWSEGQEAKALATLRMIASGDDDIGFMWRQQFVDQVLASEHPASPSGRERLRQWLGAQQRLAVGEGRELDAIDCAQAQTTLAAGAGSLALSPAVVIDAADDSRLPITTPVAVEAEEALFPDGAENPNVVRMIENEIPAIRAQIKAEMGVEVPGFRILASLSPGYRVLVHGVAVESGVIPDSVEDPYSWLLTRTALAARGRLSTFIDLQYLDEWSGSAEDDPAEILSDERQRRRFARLLKALLRDGVPILDPTRLLAIAARVDLPTVDPTDFVATVRNELLLTLPGLRAPRVDLDGETEQTILGAVIDGEAMEQRQAVAAARSLLKDALGAIDDDKDQALVVLSDLMREFARAALVTDYPRLYVFTRDELAAAAQPEPVVSG